MNDASVEGRRDLGRELGTAADDLGNLGDVELLVAGVDALGRKREQKIAIDLHAARREQRKQHFVGRARIGRGFQDDELTRRRFATIAFAALLT